MVKTFQFCKFHCYKIINPLFELKSLLHPVINLFCCWKRTGKISLHLLICSEGVNIFSTLFWITPRCKPNLRRTFEVKIIYKCNKFKLKRFISHFLQPNYCTVPYPLRDCFDFTVSFKSFTSAQHWPAATGQSLLMPNFLAMKQITPSSWLWCNYKINNNRTQQIEKKRTALIPPNRISPATRLLG